jgi:hypothetical protein
MGRGVGRYVRQVINGGFPYRVNCRCRSDPSRHKRLCPQDWSSCKRLLGIRFCNLHGCPHSYSLYKQERTIPFSDHTLLCITIYFHSRLERLGCCHGRSSCVVGPGCRRYCSSIACVLQFIPRRRPGGRIHRVQHITFHESQEHGYTS